MDRTRLRDYSQVKVHDELGRTAPWKRRQTSARQRGFAWARWRVGAQRSAAWQQNVPKYLPHQNLRHFSATDMRRNDGLSEEITLFLDFCFVDSHMLLYATRSSARTVSRGDLMDRRGVRLSSNKLLPGIQWFEYMKKAHTTLTGLAVRVAIRSCGPT